MDVRKNFFRGRLIKHKKRLPRETGESSYLEASKSHADMALSDTV